MKPRLMLTLASVLGVTLAVALGLGPSGLRTQHASAAVHGLDVRGLNRIQRTHLSGFASFEAGIGGP